MRTLRLPLTAHVHQHYAPEPSAVYSIKPRGMCLMVIEFLTKFPAAECVVTSATNDFWECVFDLFPKTLFHAFRCPLEDPPRPNVIRHGQSFDSALAAKFGERGAPYNLVFCGETYMDIQTGIYLHARPSAALLWVTDPGPEYLEGQLFLPLHCDTASRVCALVPSSGQARSSDYAGYQAAVGGFQAAFRYPHSRYDLDMEYQILYDYARSVAGLENGGSAMLQVEMMRNGLPCMENPELVLSARVLPEMGTVEPSPPPSSAEVGPAPPNDLEALLAIAAGLLPG